MKKFEKLILNGKVNWAKVYQPHKSDYHDHPIYSFDLILDTTNLDKLRQAGCKKKLKVLENGEQYVQFIRKTVASTGNDMSPLFVCDTAKQKMGNDTHPLIGNGSEVSVIFSVIPYDSYGGGVALIPDGMMVVNLIPYDPEASVGGNPFEAFQNDSDDVEF